MMKYFCFALFAVFISVANFCQSISEVEPNGCITLIGGNDQYQTLFPGTTIFGSVSNLDNEGCLYFEYSNGDEYIEDLYALD
ncbi:MAG: hypothetical protein N2445_03615, partial [Acidobacteria bacterium]|nr:hypothetical protein [Acidobacteriota bacterium]